MKSIYHEQETILLCSKKPFSRIALHEWLKNNGYKSEDDFYYFECKYKPMPWQGNTLLTVDVFIGKDGIYETEDDILDGLSSYWDKLKITYLMATRPRTLIPALIKKISDLVVFFGLEIEFNSKIQSLLSLEGELNAIADKLDEDWGGAGSETLAIMIQLEYQK